MNNTKLFNRLANEKSIYLKQHCTNPIDWWPYGPLAISKAQDENKPIFLSIGYSSCHYCHVMARESFTDQNIANLLNEKFICIKVDREEYPDMDNFYQLSAHIYTKRNGWPLSVFLLPNLKPFFAGTYFPSESSNDQASFLQVITELSDIYINNRTLVEENANKVYEALCEGIIPKEKVEFEGHFPHPLAIIDAVKTFEDQKNGGYGTNPKFPNFPYHEWMIEQILEGIIDKDRGSHAIFSIEKMLASPLYDQIRGGVHRYATDKEWMKPHFEKMLYDQAGLLKLLAKAGILYSSPLIYDALIQTLDYLMKEMNNEDQYLFSSQSAESEEVEGLYYLFTQEEFEKSLSSECQKNIAEYQNWFNITKEGNYHSGLNALSLNPQFKDQILSTDGWRVVRDIKKMLLKERANRIPPLTDTKGIASWNFALMTALMDVVQYCPIDSIKEAANNMLGLFTKKLETTFISENTFPCMDHTTTKKNNYPLSEDCIFYAEFLLRLYELNGDISSKTKFFQVLDFIRSEFIGDNSLYTRPIMQNESELYPNQRVQAYDNAFRSSAIVLIQLNIKAMLISKDHDYLTSDAMVERLVNESLLNPLNAGEALRVLTYPLSAYKIVTVPLSWLADPRFKKFTNYFMPRFTFDYHEEDNQTWQICSYQACELKGIGFHEFEKSLRPQTENGTN